MGQFNYALQIPNTQEKDPILRLKATIGELHVHYWFCIIILTRILILRTVYPFRMGGYPTLLIGFSLQCTSGSRYNFELHDENSTLRKQWSTERVRRWEAKFGFWKF